MRTADNACFDLLLPLYTQFKNMWNGNPCIRIIPQNWISRASTFQWRWVKLKNSKIYINDISINVYINEDCIDMIRWSKEKQTHEPIVQRMTRHFALIKGLFSQFTI